MWAFYRGNYSVTHKYYVCKRCGYAERDTKWKIVNDGGKAIEAVAMGIGLTLVLIFSVFMISKNVDFSSMPTWDIRLSKTLMAAMFMAPMAVASRPSRTLVTARFWFCLSVNKQD